MPPSPRASSAASAALSCGGLVETNSTRHSAATKSSEYPSRARPSASLPTLRARSTPMLASSSGSSAPAAATPCATVVIIEPTTDVSGSSSPPPLPAPPLAPPWPVWRSTARKRAHMRQKGSNVSGADTGPITAAAREPARAGCEAMLATEPVRPATEPVRPATEPVRPATEPARPGCDPAREGGCEPGCEPPPPPAASSACRCFSSSSCTAASSCGSSRVSCAQTSSAGPASPSPATSKTANAARRCGSVGRMRSGIASTCIIAPVASVP